MNEKDLQQVRHNMRTQWVDASDAMRHIAEANSFSSDEAADVLLDFGLHTLRPLRLVELEGAEIFVDHYDRSFDQTLINLLRPRSWSDLSYEERTELNHFESCVGEFGWTIPLLVDWCTQRKLTVPAEWSKWMQGAYPSLVERGLTPESIARVVDTVDPTATRRSAGGRRPSTARRDARKLDTAARYAAWRKEARKLRRDHPGKSKRWIAQRIEKMDVAAGASWETIRRNIRE